MSRNDYIISMIHSFSTGDYDGFVSECQLLIKSEEEKKNFSLASKMKRALDQRSMTEKGAATVQNFSVTPINSLRKEINKEDNSLFQVVNSEFSFSKCYLPNNTKETLEKVINQWKNREKLMKYKLMPQNKLLFYGPPGTGKTFTAYGLAHELGLPLINVKFDTLMSSYLGETGANLRKIFEYSNKNPCVLLLDEIDAIGKSRDDSQELGELKRVVISLLQNIDSFSDKSIFIACTNHEHLLDKAIWRRFDCVLEYSNPEENQRKHIIYNNFNEKNINLDDQWIDFLSRISDGISGSSLVAVIENSIRNWILSDSNNKIQDFFVEELIDKLEIQNEVTKIEIAKKLREQSRRYSYSYLSKLLNIPKSTLHNKLSNEEEVKR